MIAPEQTLTARHSLPSALRNVLSNWAGFVCACIISFFLSPFVVRHLGNSAYGIWILIGSLTGYLGLLNMGVRAGVTVYVARFHAEANDQKASAVASTALAIFLAAATLVIAASFTLAALVVRLFHIPDGYQLAARVVLILAGLNVAISLISGVFGSILAARHRFDLSNLIEVANSVLSAIAIFFVLSAGKGLIALSLLNLFFGVAAGLAYTITAFRVYPTLKINPFYCDREHLRLIFSISVYAFLLQISFNLIFYTDSVVIGRFLSLSLITYFAIAGNLMNYSRALISGISTTLTPRASALEASGGREQVQKLLIKGTSLATVVMLPIAVTFLLRGSSFIRLWMGREYGDTSGRVLGILTLALFFIPANQVATSIMGGLEKYRSLALVFCCEALCNLVLSIVLARPMGIFGVAWGTTLPSLAVSLLFWPWYLHHALGIPTRKYLISTWLRPAVAMIPCSLLTYGIERLWPAPNLSVFFLQIGAILPFAALPAWYVSFERSDREAYSLKFVQPLFRTLGWN